MCETDEFGKYISRTRVSNNISLEQLSDGICAPSNLNRIEHGKRYADKLTRDRILGRLGIDGYDYENYINIDEYRQWKSRMEILNSISNGNLTEAFQELKRYDDSNEKNSNPRLKLQFCMFAYAQIKKRKGYNRRIGGIFEKALECTAGCSWNMIPEKILSVQELSFVLDDAYYNRRSERIKIYEQVVEYIKRPYFDVFSRAMIYPKAVVHICREVFREQSEPDRQAYERMFELCNEAKNILGESKRMYYIWEISRLLKNIYGYFIKNGSDNVEASVWRAQSEENHGFMQALKEAGKLAGLSVKMQDDTYIYKEYGVYCTADVICKRRKTLGMTVKQLAEGYLSERTLSRIENGKANPHVTTIKELFRRLNMSAEYSRLEIVTDKIEAKDIVRKFKKEYNSGEYNKAEILLEELKKDIDMDISVNRQFAMRAEGAIAFRQKKIQMQEYMQIVKEALECTIPYKCLLDSKDNIFITNEEIMCINALMNCNKLEISTFYSNILQNFLELDMNKECWERQRLYNILMTNLANVKGSAGEYEYSDKLSRNIIYMCVLEKNLTFLNENFYNIAWNCREQKKNKQEYMHYAEHSYYIAKFMKADRLMRFYKSQIDEWK